MAPAVKKGKAKGKTPAETVALIANNLCGSDRAKKNAAFSQLVRILEAGSDDERSALELHINKAVLQAGVTASSIADAYLNWKSTEVDDASAMLDFMKWTTEMSSARAAMGEHGVLRALLALVNPAHLCETAEYAIGGLNTAIPLDQSITSTEQRSSEQPRSEQTRRGEASLSDETATLVHHTCKAFSSLATSADSRLLMIEAGASETLLWICTCDLFAARPAIQAEAALALSRCAESSFAREQLSGGESAARLIGRLAQLARDATQPLTEDGAAAAPPDPDVYEAHRSASLRCLSHLLMALGMLLPDAAAKAAYLQGGAMAVLSTALALPLEALPLAPPAGAKGAAAKKPGGKGKNPKVVAEAAAAALQIRCEVLAHAAMSFAVGVQSPEWRAAADCPATLAALIRVLDACAARTRDDGRPARCVLPVLTNVCLALANCARSPQLTKQLAQVVPTLLQFAAFGTSSDSALSDAKDAEATLDDALVLATVLALAHASEDPRVAKLCLQSGGVSTLLPMLLSPSPKLAGAVSAAIRHCCVVPEWRDALIGWVSSAGSEGEEQKSGTDLLVERARYTEDRSHFATAAVHALDSMSMCACSRAGRDALCSSDAMTILSTLLKQASSSAPVHAASLPVYRAACVATSSVSRESSAVRALLETGVVPSLAALSTRHVERAMSGAAAACLDTLGARWPSLRYWREGALRAHERVGAGFVDVGTRRPFATAAQLSSMPPSAQPAALLLSGVRKDDAPHDEAAQGVSTLLRRCMKDGLAVSSTATGEASTSTALKSATRLRASALATIVSDAFGGSIAYDAYLRFDETVALEVDAAKRRHASDLIPLLELKVGGARHRSLLFKALADSLELACELHAGPYSRGAHQQHAWVVLLSPEDSEGVFERHVVDLLHDVGAVYLEESDEAQWYNRLSHYKHASARA